MRSYLVCALVIGLFAASGCGDNRGSPDARDGSGDGDANGDGNASVDRADMRTDTSGTGGIGGSVGGKGGGGAGGSAGTGGTGGAGGSAGTGGGNDAAAGTGGGNDAGGTDGGAPTCNDGIMNADETGIDCGGHCGKCGPGKGCQVDADCMFSCKADKTCAACNVANDCTGQETDCIHRTCAAGVCGTMTDTVGKVVTVQTAGDCKRQQCGANGAVVSANDDTDVPDDRNACTNDICSSGSPSHTTMPNGSNCGGANHCEGGLCVGCSVAGDCPGTDTTCRARTCSATGVCGFSFAAAQTALPDPTTGDCKGLQCDGQGNTQVVNDNGDLPVDGNACTTDECTAGTPSHRPVQSGTNCGGSLVCDGASSCVQCLSASTCPGTDTDCHTRSCISGQCGITNAAANTLAAVQTPRDCKKNVCSGGVAVPVNDDLDLPVDSNPCTADVCTAGTPSNPNVQSGVSCGQNTICDGQGTCVTCVTASTCPGTDTDCHHRTCTSGTCGIANTAMGTPAGAATQTIGDCKQIQCDGQGSVMTATDISDKPVDGKACTDDICTGGVPSNPNLSSGTACGTNLMCDGSGGCVGCVTAANCGTDTDCQKRTCTNGMCGVDNTALGTLLPATAQTPGDCKKMQCDGQGHAQPANDDNDKPVDSNACTQDVCTNGNPSNPPENSGTACNQGGGSKCNGLASAPACVQCLQDSECTNTITVCQTRACTNGMCVVSNKANGTVTGNQTTGDCKKNVCLDGAEVPMNDVGDVRVDNNGCTADVCTGGVPSNPPLAQNTPCNEGGGTRCNGSTTAPACVQCNVATDCSGSDTECQTRTCTVGVCGFDFAANGKATSDQITGDCKTKVCNGTGGTTQAANADDVHPDGNDCTADLCTGGAATNPSLPQDTPCNSNNGTRCNGSTSTPLCVQCNADADCGTNTACKTFMCTAGVCGSSNKPDGFVVANPLAGDCKKDLCMSGLVMADAVADGDLPVDGLPCTLDICTIGVASNPPLSAGTICGPNLMCNGLGACVGCLTAADCPLPPNACQVRACTAGACGFTNVAADTVVSDTPLDCKVDTCDGNGNVQTVADINDKPVDNNPCTDDVCTGKDPSNPPVAKGLACSNGGSGTVCDDGGHCVECLDATTCPGGPDTECNTRTCVAGVCGISQPPDGTLVSDQVSFDCNQKVCNGVGGTRQLPDDNDVPDPTTACATPMCVAGNLMSSKLPHGSACTDNGGRTCDGQGTCQLSFDVVRVGDGVAAASTAPTAVFIEEHLVSTGAFVPISSLVTLPTTETSGSAIHAFALTGAVSGSGVGSEGELQLSQNGKYVVLAGYNRALNMGPTDITVSTAATINRMVARVDGGGGIDTTTLFGNTAFNANNVRGVTTNDGTSFWGSGAGGTSAGVWFVSLGTPSAPIQVFSSAIRWVGLFTSANPLQANQLQLYGTGSNNPLKDVFTVGTGVPMTAGQTAAALTGMPSTLSPHGFVLFDKDGNGVVETLYVADDGTVASGGGIQKWTTMLAGTPPVLTWVKVATMVDPAGTGGLRGLLGTLTGATGTDVTLIAVTTETSANRIVKFVDTNSGATPTGTVIGTAGAGTAYRGVALAPQR
jgi:hypothetical protein